MKKQHRSILYQTLALIFLLGALIVLMTLGDKKPYLAFSVFVVCMFATLILAFLIDKLRKSTQEEARRAELENILNNNPSVFTLGFDVKSLLQKSIGLNSEKGKKKLKNQCLVIVPYSAEADVALVKKCHFSDELVEGYDEISDEEFDQCIEQCEAWEMECLFLFPDELSRFSNQTFLLTEQAYRVLQSSDLFYRFLKENQFLTENQS